MPIPSDQLSDSQRLMVLDGFPAELLFSQDERNMAWLRNPPRPAIQIDKTRDHQHEQQLMEEFRKQNQKKIKLKKPAVFIDLTQNRWDSRLNRFVPIIQLENAMPKWKVVPYNTAGEIIQKGVLSIEEGTQQVALVGHMARSYAKVSADEVVKIIVHDAADGYVREWIKATDAPLPKPVAVAETVDDDEPKETKKTRGKKAKTTKATPPTKSAPQAKSTKSAPPVKVKGKGRGSHNGVGGPGVISTISKLLDEAKKGITVDEMMKVLSTKFPDRDANSMRSTVKTQMGRQKATKREDAKRGTVYSR